MSEMERCTLEQNGFVGIYYPGRIHPEKAVIAAGGQDCFQRILKFLEEWDCNAGTEEV
ncbi:MAG: hypothetical protein K6F31_06000 [Acetatifactor sp.]|nr:hypothetical protein [Acetatifactor sp.]